MFCEEGDMFPPVACDLSNNRLTGPASTMHALRLSFPDRLHRCYELTSFLGESDTRDLELKLRGVFYCYHPGERLLWRSTLPLPKFYEFRVPCFSLLNEAKLNGKWHYRHRPGHRPHVLHVYRYRPGSWPWTRTAFVCRFSLSIEGKYY